MIKNLLLTALGSLKKNKFFSLLSITGLAIGLAVFLLIAQHVRFEKSYESFISDKENIYRVKLDQCTKMYVNCPFSYTHSITGYTKPCVAEAFSLGISVG